MGGTYDLGATVNSAAAWVAQSPVLGAIAGNPLLMAAAVVVLVAVAAYLAYGRCVRATGATAAVRACVYTFIAVLCLLFVHHSAVRRSLRDAERVAEYREVFSDIRGGGERGRSRDRELLQDLGEEGASPAAGLRERADNLAWLETPEALGALGEAGDPFRELGMRPLRLAAAPR